ncbi:MAG: S4 domain-containing protein [Verrucomicrobiota bacterium]
MTNNDPPASVRLDKWLWSVRLFKTRNDAATACRLGQVRIDDQDVKAARSVYLGDIIKIDKDKMTRTVEVIALLEKRVGAKLVADYYEDRTPDEERERAKEEREIHRQNRFYLEKGLGRPTKQKRRLMDQFLDDVRKATDK